MEKIIIELTHDEANLVLSELADRSDMYKNWGREYCAKGYALGELCDDIVSKLMFNPEECNEDIE